MKFEAYTLLQSVAALIWGGVLGWERQQAGKWAGLRTHMLVCLAAMLFVKLGLYLVLRFQHDLPPPAMRADPVGIIQAIVTGISFLGAGTIFRDRDINSIGLLPAGCGNYGAGTVCPSRHSKVGNPKSRKIKRTPRLNFS